MKLYKIIVLLFVLVLLVQYAKAQLFVMPNKVVVAGFVFDAETEEPLPYVNVFVKKSRKGTITDTSGFFILYSNIGDTIIFSSIAHEKYYVDVNDSIGDIKDPAMVFLNPKIYKLASVNVIALQRYQQFKYDFIEMDLPDDAIVFANRNFPLMPAELPYYSRQGAEGFGVIMHPISALYDMFSKEGRQRRKLEELEAEDSRIEQIEKKYSADIVVKITGIPVEEAKVFMDWCNLNDYFVLSLSEYDLIKLITRQYEKYKSQTK